MMLFKGRGVPGTGVVGNVGDYFLDQDTDTFYKLDEIIMREKDYGFITIPEYMCDTNKYIWKPVSGGGGNEAPTLIEWDGNTEGLVVGFEYGSAGFYKVSDYVPTDEDIVNSVLTWVENGEDKTEEVSEESWDFVVKQGAATADYVLLGENVLVIKTAGVTDPFLNVTWPETGVYFVKNAEMGIYVKSWEFAAAPESGGGAEIATCTMRFMDEYNGQTPPSGMAHGELMGGYHYLQYKDGVLSLVSSEDYGGASDFDITLENVVCGSHVVFGWTFYEGDYGEISFEGAGSNMETLLSDPSRATNETTIFKAPSEPNAVCTVKFRGETDSWIGA